MEEMYTATGFVSVSGPQYPHGYDFMNDKGELWSDVKKNFKADTIKFTYTKNGTVMGFGKNIDFIIPTNTPTDSISEVRVEDWPPELTGSTSMFVGSPGHIECRFENLPERANALAWYFDKIGETDPFVKQEIGYWHSDPNAPYVPFQRFSEQYVLMAIELGMDRHEYNELTLINYDED
jgi:hypothetical protein